MTIKLKRHGDEWVLLIDGYAIQFGSLQELYKIIGKETLTIKAN